jgi:hypothetical protein
MFSDGYVIYPWMKDAISYCEELKQKSFVTYEEREFVWCVHEDDLDYGDLSTDQKRCTEHIFVDSFVNGKTICSSCKREVLLEKKVIRGVAYVVTFRYAMIFDFIKKTLKIYSNNVVPISDSSWRVWQDGNSTLFSILDTLSLPVVYKCLQSRNEGIVLVSLSNRRHSSFTKQYPLWSCLSLQEIAKDSHVVEDAIMANSQQGKGELELELCRKRILERLSKFSRQGTEFEKFCTKLENELCKNKTALKKFLLHLKLNALISFRALHLGGAGNPDIIRLPLYDYLRDYLKNFQALESKQYFRSKLSINDVSKALLHAQRYKQDGYLIYTLAGKIPPSIWNDVVQVRRNDGSFRYIIIDTELLAFIISSLDLESKLLS